MPQLFDGVLRFQGTWRDYQQRVLDHAPRYLADGKIHIVAAPGSGKTTLGIELIRQLGKPCLILSPSITIRQQWLERITQGFLVEGNDPQTLLSHDLRDMRPITAITYQALYSAMKQLQGWLEKGEEGDEEESEGENVDFHDFRIFEAVKRAGVGTICLDEAHHLRSEWWKALETFMKGVGDVTVISLTATPPYDSTPAQWKRYTDLCGPIDEEIFAPELVQEGSLCPHEDYVYFNWPTQQEVSAIHAHYQQVAQLRTWLMADERLMQAVASHPGLQQPEAYSQVFLDRPKYFSALLMYCQAQGIPLSPYLKALIGTQGMLPPLNDEYLGELLQGLLFDDARAYTIGVEYRGYLVEALKRAGCLHRNTVRLTLDESLQKQLMKSQGKLRSIGHITAGEYEALGDKLRLLVLCDYIKKEMLPLVGTDGALQGELGAVPIFERLRRMGLPGLRLGCLSGSVVLLPMDTQEKVKELLGERGCEATLSPVKDTGYGQLQTKGNTAHVVAVVTQLFQQGDIHALVGTKSLLGEGWDAPCVNTLILATYVGSFMLSNQMRGRTIRTDPHHPDKTGNIWHLACVYQEKDPQTGETYFAGDYPTLERRFNAFLGVSWRGKLMESGIQRLDIPPLDRPDQVDVVNGIMLCRAADRAGLRQRWLDALGEIHGEMQIQRTRDVSRAQVPTGYVFYHALGMEGLALALVLLAVFYHVMWGGLGTLAGALAVAAVLTVRYGPRLLDSSTPLRRMRGLGEGVVATLAQLGELDEPGRCWATVEPVGDAAVRTWLEGGSMRDKTTYDSCMEQLLGVIDNPRYLLAARHGDSREVYAVPEIFGRQKERAAVLEVQMQRVLGASFHLVYTRTPQGRSALLEARTQSFVNRNQQVWQGRKVVKGAYE